MGTSAAWTPERRAKQSKLMHHLRPWEKSTGPRTEEGKAISSRNADKGIAAFDARLLELRVKARLRALQMVEDNIADVGLAVRLLGLDA